MSIAVGDEFALDLETMAHQGACIGRHEGQVVFVRHGIPGEKVLVEVTGMGRKNRFAEARLLEVLEASPDRRAHPWEPADALRHLDPVGGFEYGHILPGRQRLLKTEILREQLVRLGGFPETAPELRELEVAPADYAEGADLHWRTRLHYDVDAAGRAGMHPYHSSEIVPVQDFPLATEAINELGLGSGSWQGITRIDVAAPARGSQPLLVFTAAEGVDLSDAAERVDAQLDACLPVHREVSARVEPARVPGRGRGQRPAPVAVRGEDHVLEQLPAPSGDEAVPLSFRVGPGGFWQIHREAPAQLAQTVEWCSGITEGQTVWDLYAGAGLFTALAADLVGRGGTVWSVEGSPVTAQDAAANLARNGSARSERARQAEVITTRADVQRALSGKVPTGTPDVVVLDPPRQGAGRDVVRALDAAGPTTIVYVACDPAALGRDAGYLRELGWSLENVTGLDLYPNTFHVEAVAVFERP